MSQRFPNSERLKSRREIGRLFSPGASSAAAYPLRLVYREAEKTSGPAEHRVAFVVPKRKFKRAVDRNLLKRRMREAYRLHKEMLAPTESGQVQNEDGKTDRQLVMLFMYTGKEIMPYRTIERKMRKLLDRLVSRGR